MKAITIKSFVFIMMITALSISFVFAGTTGKISGRIIDQATGEALPGCNIMLEGTIYGAASDIDGNYFILNIPPETYSLQFLMIGYGKLKITDVEVKVDFTTNVDAALIVEALQAGEVTVVAERPMIQKDLTSSTSIVSAKELASLPVTEVSDVLAMQAGYVDGSLRGGRRGEVMYMIDGVPMTDSYDRASTVDINTSMVQELQVISGAFNAEYGQAMSGIVNITTKQGSDDFGGHVETYFGDHISTHSNIFPRVNRVEPFSINNIEFGVHGPIIKNKLYYYLNVRHIYYDGHNKGQERYTPIAYTEETAFNEVSLIDSATMLGSGDWVDMGWNRKNYLQGQLIYRINDKSRISYNMIYDNRRYQDFDRSWMYNPQGLALNDMIGQTHIVKFQQQLSQSTFYDLAYSYGNREYKHYYDHFELTDADTNLLVHQDFQTTLPYQFHVGGTQNSWYSRNSGYHLGKFTLTSQLNQVHQLKMGAEFKQNNVEWESWEYRPAANEESFNVETPYITPTHLADTTVYSSSFSVNPVEFSAFIQDKIELKDFIVNVGVRIDYFNPDYVVLVDQSDPDIYNPIKPTNRFNDINGNGIQDAGEASKSIDDRREYWYVDASPKVAVSPRLGFSFPISDEGVFHFSYGHFFQTPNYTYLYTNPNFQLGSGTGHQGTIGNANMEPEKTIVGEIGLQQQLNSNLSADVTIYLKDVRDLTGTRSDVIEVFGGSKYYSRIVNSDFAVIKGITVSLNQRDPSGLYVGADYTFQMAEGTASDPYAYMNAISGGSQPEVQLLSLAWDQRHTVNVIGGYNTAFWGVNAVANYGSGLPYTPRASEDITSLLENAESKPSTFNVDVRGFYRVRIAGLKPEFFIRITNLLDKLNETGVFNDTGRAGFTGEQERIEALNVATPVNTIEEYFIIPYHYSEPRRIEIGMRIDL
ncbi:MAG: carboxypeptidase-like regulatory domain-containing protein [Candidatus Marinimicrobia bacterium]|nr:carboxypeptidase-like regulatory domain-containing protein [Candidatus Neomarinimicrobiota bacterium]